MADEPLKRKLSALKRAGTPAAARKRAKAAGARVGEEGVTREPLGVEAYLAGAELQTAHGRMFVHQRTRSEMDKGTARFLRRLAKLQESSLKLDCH